MKLKNWMVVGLFSVCSLQVQAEKLTVDAQKIFDQVVGSVVSIHAIDTNGVLETQGSGVVVGKELIVTNCHVIEEAATIRVLAAQGQLIGVWTRQVANLDLCLLNVTGLKAAPLELTHSDSPNVGAPIYAVGNPLGFGLAVSRGLVAVSASLEGYLIVTASLSPGSSGGGLFDTSGRLLGITTATLGVGQNLNKIVTAEGITTLLEKGEPRPSPRTIPVPEISWNEEARNKQTAGDWMALEKHAQAWNQAQPSSAQALVFLGLAQSQLKQHTLAETSLRKALVLDQYYPYGWYILAMALYDNGKVVEAEQALKQAENRRPFDYQPNQLRAEWLRLQGKPIDALSQIKEALRKDPEPSYSWHVLADIENKLGHSSEASKAYKVYLRLLSADAEGQRRLAERTVDAGNADEIKRLEKRQEIANEQESKARIVVGLHEMNLDHLAQAELMFRAAVALTPKSSGAMNALGVVVQKTNRFAEAESMYTKAIALDSDNSDPIINRAGVRNTLKKSDLALDDAQHAVTLFPNVATAWQIYGSLKFKSGKYSEASTAFSKMDTLTKLTADELTSWGESLVGTSDLEGAFKVLKKAEAIDPQLVRMHLTMAKLMGGKGDLQTALDYENRALAVDPVNTQAWSGKGYALMKMGKLPEAVQALETAVRLDPEVSNAWINLGEAQMRSRNLNRAIQALEKARSLNPNAMDARLYLAQSYLGARLLVKAREQVEQILAQNPNFAPALGVATMTYLMEGNPNAASYYYFKLKALDPAMAKNVRTQAIVGGLVGVQNLHE